jgi:hypothetical protein
MRIHNGPIDEYLCRRTEEELIGQGVASLRAIEAACKHDCGRMLCEPCPFDNHSKCWRIKAAALRAVKEYDTRN